jgi:E3 ubiquitin-protein ligase DOA10
MYVGVIRENLRPGVLWFIKDPNDPNFNAMHEIFHRPLFSQLRKLFLAIFFYGVVILGVFGGSVSLVSCFDFIVSKMGKDLLKVFPLRLEYHDTIGDIPFDLFFFQFIIPVFYRVIDPKTKFKAVVREWFYFVSKKLSLSHFLLGKAQVDEESDDEDENQRDWRGLQNGASRSDQSDEEWEDISNRREKRYLRVPNRDMIDFKPGETLLVWMKESDPVFGRPNESPQDIQRNWTKVYVPTNFYPRLVFVLFLQWFSFAFGISGLLAVPLIVGRIVFVKLNQLVTRGPVIPDGFNNPVKAFREDLPTHDVYSYLLGVFVTYTFSMIIYKVYKYITRSKLVRKNAIRRSQTSRQSESFRDSWSKYYHRRGRSTLQKLFKLSYLVSIIVFIIPILLGLLFNLMIISPIDAILNRTPIVFILIDWSTGAMALRVIYNVILMNPESRICRLITDAQNQHISQLNLWELNRKIFIPLISTCFGLLSLPFLGHVYELVFGTFCFNIEIDGVCLMVKRFSLVFLGGFYFGIKASRYAGQRLHEWFEHLKDDQYLIGRTLENVGE